MILDLLIRAQTLNALILLLYGHVDAHERVVLARLVILLNNGDQALRQAVPLNISITVVQHLNFYILCWVSLVLDHKMSVIDLSRCTRKNCEVNGTFWLRPFNEWYRSFDLARIDSNYASARQKSICSP